MRARAGARRATRSKCQRADAVAPVHYRPKVGICRQDETTTHVSRVNRRHSARRRSRATWTARQPLPPGVRLARRGPPSATCRHAGAALLSAACRLASPRTLARVCGESVAEARARARASARGCAPLGPPIRTEARSWILPRAPQLAPSQHHTLCSGEAPRRRARFASVPEAPRRGVSRRGLAVRRREHTGEGDRAVSATTRGRRRARWLRGSSGPRARRGHGHAGIELITAGPHRTRPARTGVRRAKRSG